MVTKNRKFQRKIGYNSPYLRRKQQQNCWPRSVGMIAWHFMQTSRIILQPVCHHGIQYGWMFLGKSCQLLTNGVMNGWLLMWSTNPWSMIPLLFLLSSTYLDICGQT